MPLPAGNDYALANVPAPAGDLTDFILLVDLSRLPQDWWDAVDTTDATRGRAAKDDGTELACDWIAFDDVAQTGVLRVRWSGTLAAAGGAVLRIYPPQAANSDYAVGDTFGRYAAYDSAVRRYAPNGADQGRTANTNAGSINGGLTAGGASGPVGPASDYDGTDDRISIDADASLEGFTALTYMWWSNWSGTGNAVVYASGNANGNYHLVGYNTNYGMANSGKIDLGLDGALGVQSTTDAPTTPAHVAVTWDGSDARFYINGALDATVSLASVAGFTGGKAVGARIESGADRFFDGLLAEHRVEAVQRSTAYIAHESDQILDQSSFWGTWAWQTLGGTAANITSVDGDNTVNEGQTGVIVAGSNFEATQGTGEVRLSTGFGANYVVCPVNSWSNTSINIDIPAALANDIKFGARTITVVPDSNDPSSAHNIAYGSATRLYADIVAPSVWDAAVHLAHPDRVDPDAVTGDHIAARAVTGGPLSTLRADTSFVMDAGGSIAYAIWDATDGTYSNEVTVSVSEETITIVESGEFDLTFTLDGSPRLLERFVEAGEFGLTYTLDGNARLIERFVEGGEFNLTYTLDGNPTLVGLYQESGEFDLAFTLDGNARLIERFVEGGEFALSYTLDGNPRLLERFVEPGEFNLAFTVNGYNVAVPIAAIGFSVRGPTITYVEN